ncbi:hypothetical protein DER46DRAFT_264931 [Fusarium sp. MPI-SDFR-AT-0072]|nr:hypothetical protein DER46DRAFT_264931 [Fusarium sp. MPI-SDFR-AT-0072]
MVCASRSLSLTYSSRHRNSSQHTNSLPSSISNFSPHFPSIHQSLSSSLYWRRHCDRITRKELTNRDNHNLNSRPTITATKRKPTSKEAQAHTQCRHHTIRHQAQVSAGWHCFNRRSSIEHLSSDGGHRIDKPRLRAGPSWPFLVSHRRDWTGALPQSLNHQDFWPASGISGGSLQTSSIHLHIERAFEAIFGVYPFSLQSRPSTSSPSPGQGQLLPQRLIPSGSQSPPIQDGTDCSWRVGKGLFACQGLGSPDCISVDCPPSYRFLCCLTASRTTVTR